MSWLYSQSRGELRRNGLLIGRGYSGAGRGKNNPRLEAIRDVGPIPRGHYRIGVVHNSDNTGPRVMNLRPIGHRAHGRISFEIHGDNTRHTASRGCIIFPRVVRDRIAASGDTDLEVTR